MPVSTEAELKALKGKINDKDWVDEWLNHPSSWGKVWYDMYYGNIFPTIRKLHGSFKGKTVLVVGTGGGTEAEWLVKQGADVTCLDVNNDFLEVSKLRFKQKNLKAKFVLANGEKLPFRENSFDICFFFGVLHHIPDFEKALKESARVANTVILGNEPREIPILRHIMKAVNWNTEYEDLETHRFSDSQLKEILLESGFKRIKQKNLWAYFPSNPHDPKSSLSIRNNPVISFIWTSIMRFLSFFFSYFGHDIILVASKT